MLYFLARFEQGNIKLRILINFHRTILSVRRSDDPQLALLLLMGEAKKLLPGLDYCGDAYQAIEGADALVLLTEWNEFRALDLVRVRSLLRAPVVIDLRNIYQPEEMTEAGFVYHSIGRAAAAPAAEASPSLRAIA